MRFVFERTLSVLMKGHREGSALWSRSFMHYANLAHETSFEAERAFFFFFLSLIKWKGEYCARFFDKRRAGVRLIN
jgi:hypothetical protein